MKILRLLLPVVLCAATALAQAPAADPLHGWLAASTPDTFEAWLNQRLAAAQADIAKLVAVQGPRTVENTLRPFDDAQNELTIAGNNAYLLYSLADAAALRDKGQALSAKVASTQTDLGLNQAV